MRWIVGLLTIPLLLAQDESPVFRANTRLVQFSVVVLDKHGNAVTDLRQDELKLEERGKPRDVAFFRFEGATESRAAPRLRNPEVFSNRVEAVPEPPRTITALVLDTLNTPPEKMMWVRAQLTRYLRQLAPQTRVAVYHLGAELRVLYDFTEDAEALRERLRRVELPAPLLGLEDVGASIRDAEALLRLFPDDAMLAQTLETQIEMDQLVNANARKRRLDATLASLDALGAHLAGIPGRKNLVWIGGGVSMLSITGAMGFGPRGGFQSYENLVVATARRLAQRGIALYAVDSAGLTAPPNMTASIGKTPNVTGRGRFSSQQQAEQLSSDPLPAAYRMADITGGRVIKNTNDPAQGLRQAEQDVHGAYSVAFYTPDEPDGRWHGVKVKVSRPGVKLLYREGYLSENGTAEAVDWGPADWQSVIANPLGSTAISIDARCEPVAEAPPGKIALVMQVEPTQLQFAGPVGKVTAEVEIAIAEKDAQGRFRLMQSPGTFLARDGNRERVTVENTRFAIAWRPAAGTKVIRLIVHDRRSHQYGTLDLPYERLTNRKSP